MNKKNVLDVLWTIFGAISARFGALLLSIWIAREVGKNNFAYIGIYYTTALLGVIFAGAGVSNVTVKYLAEYRVSNASGINQIISVTYVGCIFGGLIFSGGVIFVAMYFGAKIFSSQNAVHVMYYAAASIFFMALISGQSAILYGYDRFDLAAKINVYTAVLSFVVVMGLGSWFGLSGILWGLVLSQAFQALIGLFFVKNILSGSNWLWSDAKRSFYLLKNNAVPTAFSSFIVAGVNWVVMTWIESRVGLGDLSVYNLANQWKAALLFLPVTFGSMFMAKMAASAARGVDVFQTVRRFIPAALFFSGALFLVIYVTSGWLLGLYGEGFRGGVDVFLLVMFSAVFISASNILSKFMISTGNIKEVVSMDLLWAISFVSGAYLLIDGDGVFGVAQASVLAAVFQLLVQLLLFKYCEGKRV